MSKWRRGEIGDSIRVVFDVRRKDHPELFDWLCSLPYGKSAERIRESLTAMLQSGGHQRGAEGMQRTAGPLMQRPRDGTVQVQQHASPAPDSAPRKGEEAKREEPPDAREPKQGPVSVADSPQSRGFTPELAKFILEIDKHF